MSDPQVPTLVPAATREPASGGPTAALATSTAPSCDLGSAASVPAPEVWDLVIEPREGWFNLHLDDLWRYRDLVTLFVRRDFVAQFKQTILGPAWFVLQPLLTTIMFTVVFGNIAKLDTDGLPKILFYMSGNILWLYFSTCLTSTSNTFAGNAHLFGKVYFPRLAVPVAVVISQILRLALQFVFFLGFWVVYALFTDADIHFTPHALLLPLLVVIMAALGLGCGILISAVTTKYRDLQYLVQFGVQLAMYTTTTIFPLSAIKGGNARYFILANPMTPIIETFRYGFLGSGVFDWGHLVYSMVCAVVLLAAGVVIFNHVERTFMDTV
jgi:lipopolysaccharide transport system permease protein